MSLVKDPIHVSSVPALVLMVLLVLVLVLVFVLMVLDDDDDDDVDDFPFSVCSFNERAAAFFVVFFDLG